MKIKLSKRTVLYIILFIALVEFPAIRTYQLITNKDYYGWPAESVCRICNKTIWTWQSYERREFVIKNKGNYTHISANGLVHKHCKGNPTFECEISIK